MIVIKDSLRGAPPRREAQGMYTSGYTFIFFAIETDRLRVGKLPAPTGSEAFYCFRNRQVAGRAIDLHFLGSYPPNRGEMI